MGALLILVVRLIHDIPSASIGDGVYEIENIVVVNGRKMSWWERITATMNMAQGFLT